MGGALRKQAKDTAYARAIRATWMRFPREPGRRQCGLTALDNTEQ